VSVPAPEPEYDFIVVGSGFGGSVAAMRLAEKGYSVCVVERGKRFRDEDFPKTNWSLRKYLWMPKLKCFGIQNMSLFRGVMILSGTGVGGGSLVYGNTLYQPGDEFFRSPEWGDLADWRAELDPHYQTARRMLGVTTNPRLTFVDRLLKETAEELGRGNTFRPTEVGVFFGQPGVTVPDPYFGGEGPPRAGCISCGGCFVGCRHNAKNSLSKNYLWFAEKRGAVIEAERDVVDIRPLSPDGSAGYQVVTRRSTAWLNRQTRVLRARQVILSGGVLGTVRLLLRCKHQTRSLPNLSDRLGYSVRTNSETLVGVSEPGASPEHDYSRGVAISSSFHPNEHTHIEPCRYPAGSSFMRLLGVPMTDSSNPVLRPLVLLWTIARHPLAFLKLIYSRRWAQSTVILLVMQTLDNKMRFALGRNLLTAFTRGMGTRRDRGAAPIPVYFPEAQDVARRIARKVDGIPQNTVNEVLFNIPTTAHILGGCPIGASAESGVIDSRHQVFGYRGLYVCDGSAIPANLGVNPSLTITAMTERAMSFIPDNHR
jgi:cholesterol oxidase